MERQSIKIDLPTKMYRRLEKLAAATNQSLDAVLLQTIRGNLPPLVDDVPRSMRGEFSRLLKQKDEALWAIARTPQDRVRWRRHQYLLRKNIERVLTGKEQKELETLRTETDNLVLKKSFALAVLKWRGHTLPTVGDAEV